MHTKVPWKRKFKGENPREFGGCVASTNFLLPNLVYDNMIESDKHASEE